MDLGLAFALGLLGSLHCAAMCGPLTVALPVLPRGSGGFAVQRIVYQLGRIATYCALGLLAGFVGKSILLLGLQRWLSISLGVAILVGLVASKRVVAAGFVMRLVKRLRAMMSAQLQQHSFRSLVLLGMLNGLLPCGLVYVALAGATAQGEPLKSFDYMAMFGLGTTPAMLAISLSGKLIPLQVSLKLRRAIPIGICLLAGLLILRGLALGIPYVSPDLASGAPPCCAAP